MSWHDLAHRRVLDSDGKTVGRVVDLLARVSDDDTAVVEALLVSRVGLTAETAVPWRRHGTANMLEVPRQWARLDGGCVRLSVPRARIGRFVAEE